MQVAGRKNTNFKGPWQFGYTSCTPRKAMVGLGFINRNARAEHFSSAIPTES